MYSSERGYGFDFGSRPVGVERGGTDPLTGRVGHHRRAAVLLLREGSGGKLPHHRHARRRPGRIAHHDSHGGRPPDGGGHRHPAGEIRHADVLCQRAPAADRPPAAAQRPGRHGGPHVPCRRGGGPVLGREAHRRVQRLPALPRRHGDREGRRGADDLRRRRLHGRRPAARARRKLADPDLPVLQAGGRRLQQRRGRRDHARVFSPATASTRCSAR